MHTRRRLLLALLGACVLPAQEGQPSVQVAGAVKQPLTFAADDLAKMPRVSVKTTNNGMETVYEGACAGQRASRQSPVELIDHQFLLADTANGKPLFGAQRRFRLVVPKDKAGARSVRMLARLEVVQTRK